MENPLVIAFIVTVILSPFFIINIFHKSIDGFGGNVIEKLKFGKENLFDYDIKKIKIKNTKYYYFKCKKEIKGIDKKNVILFIFDKEEKMINKKIMPDKENEDEWIMEQVEKEEFNSNINTTT